MPICWRKFKMNVGRDSIESTDYIRQHYLDIIDGSAIAISCTGIPWEKIGNINKRVIGLHRQPAPTWPDKKKADPMTRLASIFAADPRVDAIKSYPVHTEPYIDIWILNLIFDIRYMGLMRNANCDNTAIFKINKIKRKLRSDSSEYNLSQNTNFRSLMLFCVSLFLLF